MVIQLYLHWNPVVYDITTLMLWLKSFFNMLHIHLLSFVLYKCSNIVCFLSHIAVVRGTRRVGDGDFKFILWLFLNLMYMLLMFIMRSMPTIHLLFRDSDLIFATNWNSMVTSLITTLKVQLTHLLFVSLEFSSMKFKPNRNREARFRNWVIMRNSSTIY